MMYNDTSTVTNSFRNICWLEIIVTNSMFQSFNEGALIKVFLVNSYWLVMIEITIIGWLAGTSIYKKPLLGAGGGGEKP